MKKIVKAVGKDKYEVTIKKVGERSHTDPVSPYYKSQDQMLSYWNKKYAEVVKDIKEQVLEVMQN